MFLSHGAAALVPVGDANWKKWFGEDKSKWIFNTECCANAVYYRNGKCGPPACENKCDVTKQCAQPTCASLVWKYPCAEYYAPGKIYAGWCDKTCGYGTCSKQEVFSLQ